MGKASSITLISAVAALIAFSTFITVYPQGIKIFDGYDVHYEGDDILFYGGAEGSAFQLIAYNYSAVINNRSMDNDILAIKGNIYFSCAQAILNGTKELILTNKTIIEGNNCKVNGKFYEKIEGEIKGDAICINYSYAKLYEGKREDYSNISLDAMNKVFLITGGNLFIDGEKISNFSAILFRGEGEITKNILDGRAYFIMIDNEIYENVKKKISIFPAEMVIIWGVAIVIFILSSFVKKGFFKEFDKPFGGFAIAISILFFAISFYLWNNEINRLLGINIFYLLKNKLTIYSIFFISFSIVPYVVAIALIGFPSRIAVSSIFEIFGLSNIGKGIGRAIGFMMATFLGITWFSSIFKITLFPLFKMLFKI